MTPTVRNQILLHLFSDILQTLHNNYGNVEDMHMLFLEVFGHFLKKLHVVEHFSSMFCIGGTYFVQPTPLTPFG
jgi:hypothetical protein